MSPLMAYMGSESERFPCWLEVLDREVVAPFSPDEMNGWGVGYYTGHRALSIKRPHCPREYKFSTEIKDNITSKVAMWHMQSKEQQPTTASDTQPFHYGSWLFTCDGTRPLSDNVAEEMPSQIAEHFRRRIKGRSTGEYLFYWILQRLQKEGWLDHPPTQIKEFVLHVQRSITTFAEAFMPDGTLKETAAVLTNGRIMFAFARTGGMYISFKEGLAECSRCGAHMHDEFSLRESHNRSRAIFVVYGLAPQVEGTAWQPVNADAVVAFDRDFATHNFRW